MLQKFIGSGFYEPEDNYLASIYHLCIQLLPKSYLQPRNLDCWQNHWDILIISAWNPTFPALALELFWNLTVDSLPTYPYGLLLNHWLPICTSHWMERPALPEILVNTFWGRVHIWSPFSPHDALSSDFRLSSTLHTTAGKHPNAGVFQFNSVELWGFWGGIVFN